jgi:antitoxin component of RelBE/YafQ-DinJ toxin-antitoxin module
MVETAGFGLPFLFEGKVFQGVNKKKVTLSAQEMVAARMLVEDSKASGRSVALKLGMDPRTLCRHIAKPQFKEYQEKLRAEIDAALKKESAAALKKIKFDKPDAVEALVKIIQADGGQPTVAGQIRAIEVLAKILGWMPEQVLDPGIDGYKETPADKAKPSFYRSAWRDDPVQ